MVFREFGWLRCGLHSLRKQRHLPTRPAVLHSLSCILALGRPSSEAVMATVAAWQVIEATGSEAISSFRNVAGGRILKQWAPASLSGGCLGPSRVPRAINQTVATTR